jgi:general secretion pathway protein G
MRSRVRNAFTLVEILIVVVILGILAAIVVPQFTNATQDAQGGNLQTQLDTLQNQIELFKARNPATGYPVVADFAADSTNAQFAGQGWGFLIDTGYLKSPPINPVSQSSSVVADGGATAGSGGGTAGAGWTYDPATGTLGACYFNEKTGKVEATIP